MVHRIHPSTQHIALGLLLSIAAMGVCLLPSVVQAQSLRVESPATRFIVRQRVVALLNPMGAEHYIELASRTRVGDQGSLWFTGAHLEVGAVSSVSPVYAAGGGYLQLSPLSFLVLRAQLTGEGIWPIGMDGAGYYGFDTYDPHLCPQHFSAADASSATGYRAHFTGTLQGMVPMGSARLLFLNKFGGEFAEIGAEPFYYDVRHDISRARADWLLTNEAFLGVDVVVGENVILRAGAYDSLRYLPASGQANNQVGPLVMMIFGRPGKALSAVEPFVRGGYYTHHGSRLDGATILGGISLRYDLGGA
ncbi:MAG: hypothetical protein DRJ42_18960 [Deltaproteobacteria bacterium]|nr:MAG: hypothetical protein DRJ42_18960 [Deltaproteobacteria bacterium]